MCIYEKKIIAYMYNIGYICWHERVPLKNRTPTGLLSLRIIMENSFHTRIVAAIGYDAKSRA